MNAICTFVYVFVVYFSFAPVISASIHCYVNYFDIQVLMMVTETETLMSTLHLNKFTYLDYVFQLPTYCWILIHIYFHIRIADDKSCMIKDTISLLLKFHVFSTVFTWLSAKSQQSCIKTKGNKDSFYLF